LTQKKFKVSDLSFKPVQFINFNRFKGVRLRPFYIILSVTMVIDFEGGVNPLFVAYNVRW